MGAGPGRQGELQIQKVKGEENIADGLTKHVELAKVDYYMKECGLARRTGRHELCPRCDQEMLSECGRQRLSVFCTDVCYDFWRQFRHS